MRYRRADLAWVPLLVLSAGLAIAEVLTTGGGWRSVLMVVFSYVAGRRMASLSPALWVFTLAAFTGLAVAFWHSPDPLAGWFGLVAVEFGASVLPWWIGRYRHLRAEQIERERGIVAEQARLRERARIAQDMHDSLGHELALIALHGGALELARGLTVEQSRAAGELRSAAVRATHRLHEIVRVFADPEADAALQPAGESIAELVRRAAAAGLPVRLRHDGAIPEWSPTASQAAHRVVQESLTNAARHAPGAAVTVTVAPRDGDTRIEVVNDAPAQPGVATGTGQGLIGLDERVRLAGGRLDAGPRPGGGWVVTAVLPDHSGPRPADGSTGFELGVSRRLTRRRLLQTAALPVGAGLALIAALVVVQVLTVVRSGLPNERYDQLRLGQPQTDVRSLLPAHDVRQAPSVLAPPPQPVGATCVYYQAGTSLGDIDPDLYQLCFAGDVLVWKNRLRRA